MNQITLMQNVPMKIPTSNKYHTVKNTMDHGELLFSMDEKEDHVWFPIGKGESFTFKKTLYIKQDTVKVTIIPILKGFM